MSEPARLVAASTYPVHPRLGGGSIRAANLLAAICHDGQVEAHVVSVTVDPALAGEHRVAEGVTERVLVRSEAHRHAEDRLRLVTGPVSITDIAVSLLWPATIDLRDELARQLDGADVAQLVQPYLSTAFAELAPGITTVCDEHNFELDLKRRIYPDNEGGHWLLDRVAEAERLATKDAALVTATTDADLSGLVAEFGISEDRAAIVPNGVDTNAIAFVTGDARRARRARLIDEFGIHPAAPRLALFVGSGHGPNIDAGRSLLAAAHDLPEIQFLLAGRHSLLLGRSTRPAANVHLLGEVSEEQLDLLLAGADVALNPMTTGGGSNLKLLSYLAAGLPVVTTAVGARGLDPRAAGLVIASVENLGNAIELALEHGGSDRAAAGRAYVRSHCDWSAIGARYRGLIRERALR